VTVVYATSGHLQRMTLRSVGSYARELRPALSADAFAPSRSRLFWLPVHWAVIAGSVLAIASGRLAWPLELLFAVAIGASFAGLTFVAHETLHGGIVRGKRLRHVVGWLSFLPFVLSPRLWVAWHNRVHHGNTAIPGADPDAYPTLAEYEKSLHLRVADHFSLGRRHFGGALTLLVGFSVQSMQMLFAARRMQMTDRDRHLAVIETLVGVGLWTALAVVLGPLHFMFAFVLPLVVANVVVMAFIITNHSLSPLNQLNDPLANSLSVTAPRWVEWVTLRFGFHVEHHIFPAMSSRKAVEVRDLIRARWPDRYQSMSIGRALLTIARTGRVYKDERTLFDPRTGHEWPALAQRAPSTNGVEHSVERAPRDAERSSRPAHVAAGARDGVLGHHA
jgi:fatty acid desaturase